MHELSQRGFQALDCTEALSLGEISLNASQAEVNNWCVQEFKGKEDAIAMDVIFVHSSAGLEVAS